jgi:uncharacterized protein
MDFNFKKPSHLVVVAGLFIALFLFVGYPLLSIFLPSQISPSSLHLTPAQKTIMEIILLVFQFIIVFGGMIIVPVLWYLVINRVSVKEMLKRIYLRFERFQIVLPWSVVAIIAAFTVTIVIGLGFTLFTNTNPDKFSNIPDLLNLFSVPSLYILVTIQPFCEEFFFRGFLLNKISDMWGTKIAVVSTSILFGVSHLTYTYSYTAIMAVFLGLIFALVVVKTKNLYTSIIAHTVINVASLTLYFFGKSYGF